MKNVLIIGGSSDIGISLAKKFIANGDRVLSTYNSHYVEDQDIEFIKCDIKNEVEIEKIFKYAMDLFGRIDVLINLACVSMDNSFLNKTKKEFMNVLEVNLVGMFLCNQMYCRYMDNGLIVNMSSTDGVDTYSEYSLDYSVSKSGIITMSKVIAMATENKVVCICPNWIDSDSTKMINKDYLDGELKRIGQDRLIKIDELVDSVYKIVNSDVDTGSVYRIDIKDDKLWIERM